MEINELTNKDKEYISDILNNDEVSTDEEIKQLLKDEFNLNDYDLNFIINARDEAFKVVFFDFEDYLNKYYNEEIKK